MKIQVTKEEFYKAMGPLDVVLSVYPDGVAFKTRTHELVGRTVGGNGHYWDAEETYFLYNHQ